MPYTSFYPQWHDRELATDTPIIAAALQHYDDALGSLAEQIDSIQGGSLIGVINNGDGTVTLTQLPIKIVAATVVTS